MRGTPKLDKRKGSPFWYITFSAGRRSKRFSTGTGNRSEAERVLAQFLIERRQTQSLEELYVSDLLERYQAKKPNDIALEYNLRNLRPYFKDYAVSQLTRHSVSDYTQHRLKQLVVIGKNKGMRTVSPATVKRELDMLGAALNLAKKEGLITEIPIFEKPKPSLPRERWLTQEEVQRLFKASGTDNLTAFLHVSINTAARPSSVLELRWDQIDLEKRLIHFNPVARAQTKKYRPTVYINDSLRAFLTTWQEECKSEFVCGGVKSLKKSFAHACKEAKISGATPYTLRHTAVTWVVREGFSLALAGQLAGHKDPRTTMRYAKHDASFTEGVVTALASGAQLAHKIAKRGKKGKTPATKSKGKQAC